MNRMIEMLKKSIFVVVAILVCLLLFAGCNKKAAEQTRLELDKVKATLEKTQAELEAAKIQIKEAEKLKTEYDKLYIVNQNLKGQLEAEKHEKDELIKSIDQNQRIIAELREQLKK
jgi:uncharacterized membrane-anchored protein YhcB (DUF1043 family)